MTSGFARMMIRADSVRTSSLYAFYCTESINGNLNPSRFPVYAGCAFGRRMRKLSHQLVIRQYGGRSMPIEKNSIIMKTAREKGYGVAAFNLFNYESIAWAIEAAERESRPVIAMLYPPCKGLIPFHAFAAITRSLAEKATVLVGLHLDHSQSFTEIMEGVAAGFTSVMIDASRLPLDENMALTRKVVEACHPMGVDVEAELGLVGLASNHEDFNNPAGFTKPEEAVAFIRETGVEVPTAPMSQLRSWIWRGSRQYMTCQPSRWFSTGVPAYRTTRFGKRCGWVSPR